MAKTIDIVSGLVGVGLFMSALACILHASFISGNNVDGANGWFISGLFFMIADSLIFAENTKEVKDE